MPLIDTIDSIRANQQQQQQLAVEIEMQRMRICHELNKRLKDLLEGGRGLGGVTSSTDLAGSYVHIQNCDRTSMMIKQYTVLLDIYLSRYVDLFFITYALSISSHSSFILFYFPLPSISFFLSI